MLLSTRGVSCGGSHSTSHQMANIPHQHIHFDIPIGKSLQVVRILHNLLISLGSCLLSDGSAFIFFIVSSSSLHSTSEIFFSEHIKQHKTKRDHSLALKNFFPPLIRGEGSESSRAKIIGNLLAYFHFSKL